MLKARGHHDQQGAPRKGTSFAPSLSTLVTGTVPRPSTRLKRMILTSLDGAALVMRAALVMPSLPIEGVVQLPRNFKISALEEHKIYFQFTSFTADGLQECTTSLSWLCGVPATSTV